MHTPGVHTSEYPAWSRFNIDQWKGSHMLTAVSDLRPASRPSRWAVLMMAVSLLLVATAAGTKPPAANAGKSTTSTEMRSARGASGANGIVAIHTGSWGYREVVYGRGTTHWLATSSYPLSVAGTLIAWSGGIRIPVLLPVYLGTMVYRAEQADNSGRCFAMVRPTWVPIYFAAVESWGCR